MSKRYDNLRINIFLIFVFLLSGLVLYRLFILSIVRHSAYSRTAQAQNESISNILARGSIYLSDKDSNLTLAATNKKFPLVYAVPADIEDSKRDEISVELAKLLGVETLAIKEKIDSSSNNMKVIARRLETGQVEAIKSLKFKGIGISYEMDRLYPGGNLAANVIGFLGYDAEGKRAGQYGVEAYYDQDLFGHEPNMAGIFSEVDPFGIKKIFSGVLGDKTDNPPKKYSFDKPADIALTIDKNVQVFAETKLKELVSRWQADNGTVIIQEPDTGRILAMVDWPDFNPNLYSSTEPKYFLNSSVNEVYEPGSSFKPITMSAGIDLSKVTPQTTYTDSGVMEISGYSIRNFDNKAHGVQTMSQVLEHSLNTGAMFVENLVGDDNFLNYVINNGFGQKTGVDLPGEVNGDVTNLYSGRKINYLTASFGQGIAVTPLQMVNAYSAIANGGKLMRPYVVEKIIKEGGEEIVTKPEIVGIPISEKTAVKIQSMLISVVDNGFDKARIKGYDIAGKTGTAQIPDGTGGYSSTEFIHNFVGFAPAYDAKFVILVKMERPKGIAFAADSLSPTFKEIAGFLLNYYNIPPTRK
ncbi:MAG: penicillin-binding protein 2 [Candidatus Yanofskybacteria bacterium]|nr:penicillin-binding protein 2 [Candidatus Yanofskybacteria bacterium]